MNADPLVLSAVAVDPILATPELTYWQDARKRFVRNRLAVVGLAVLLFFILVGIFHSLLITKGYNDLTSNILKRPGDSRWWLGTDDQGRDVFTRVVLAIGTSLSLGAIVATCSILIGVVFGGLAGFYGGAWIDTAISRLIDTFYAIPYVIIGIAMISIFGSKFIVVVASLVITGWYSTARLFRASVLQVRSSDYIEAAKATGAGNFRIFISHVLPNAIPAVIVTMGFSVSSAILSESIFSFLGIGFIEPKPTLGVMIRGARNYLASDPHLFFVPGGVLGLLTLSIVLIADGLRDALDPKLRGAR